MWQELETQIQQVVQRAFVIRDRTSISGGSINQAYRISDGDQSYFVKLNTANKVSMFEAEALGLREMHRAQAIRVPKPLCWGTAGSNSYIVMEWLSLGPGAQQGWVQMGAQLAALHRATSEQGFGWGQNNTIGDTPQPNPWTTHWGEFFAEHRIGFQLKLAARRGRRFELGDRLVDQIPRLLANHHPEPALVHGDLWSGNAAFTAAGEPVILDPAVYFGDREVDLAMSELFGGFPRAFYQGYDQAYAIDAGYEQRKTLYNLYHILNHFNLFGGGYGNQSERMMAQILAMT